MQFRLPGLVLAFGVLMLVAVQDVHAKSIPMGTHSRSAVQSACNRAGGGAFGIADEGAPYGCANGFGAVSCTPDSQCVGVIQDMRPVTGNSLELILGPGKSGQPMKVPPVDARAAHRVNP